MMMIDVSSSDRPTDYRPSLIFLQKLGHCKRIRRAFCWGPYVIYRPLCRQTVIGLFKRCSGDWNQARVDRIQTEFVCPLILSNLSSDRRWHIDRPSDSHRSHCISVPDIRLCVFLRLLSLLVLLSMVGIILFAWMIITIPFLWTVQGTMLWFRAFWL